MALPPPTSRKPAGKLRKRTGDPPLRGAVSWLAKKLATKQSPFYQAVKGEDLRTGRLAQTFSVITFYRTGIASE